MDSLRARLTLTTAVVLVAFLGLAGLALDRAFQRSAEAGVRQSLEARVYLLLGAAELDAGGALRMPATLAEPRLGAPDSGLYAAIRDADGEILWRSDSSLGRRIDYPAGDLASGTVYGRAAGPGETLHTLAYPVAWELEDGSVRRLDFLVATSAAGAAARVAGFRRALWGWLAGVAAVLLAVQAGVLRWGLRPLRRAAAEVAAIEAGDRDRLGGGYPRELRPLTENLNALLAGNAARFRRQRDALADLGHSLKTPLAVLRTVADEGEPSSAAARSIREQAQRMEAAVGWHLQRAEPAGAAGVARAVSVDGITTRVAATLAKVHPDKPVTLERDIPRGAVFLGDPDDLTEVLGNLLDNAWKWCAGRVHVGVAAAGDGWIALSVADDGPGIPEARRHAVLERGVRGDERVPGDGIGLDIVRRMVEQGYGGRIELTDGPLGGLRATVTLPGRAGADRAR